MAVIHISEEEASSDLSALLVEVKHGTEFVIEAHDQPVAVLRAPDADPKPKLLSEARRLARERNCQVLLDDQFGQDLEAVIRRHAEERLIDPWEST